MSKKLLTYALVVTTALWSLGLFAMPVAVGAASAGDLIKLQCATGASVTDPCRAVYYLGSDGKRYVFPNEKTYMTWYSDFSGVKVVSSTEMSSYPIGGNVTYRPGVKLVKITTDPKVYAVASNGTLRWVTTADIAVDLYGSNWATKVEDVPDAFFVNYKMGADIASSSSYSASDATANAGSINEDKGLGGAISTGSALTVSLASDTPASGIVVSGAARVPFTKINLTAPADGDIIIDSWKVVRSGLASDSDFASVDILDAATMLPINDSSKTLTSEHYANFTEDFTVPAGTTKSVIIAGNMASSLATLAGEVPSLGLQSITVKGSSAIVGSLPIIGNYQTTNGTITIGSATVSRGAYTNATDTTLEVGKTNYTFFSFKIQNGSAEEAQFSQVKVYNAGSASLATDLANIKLYEEGTLLATGAVSGNYVTFNISPVTLTKGQTKQFQVKADVVDGSARTIVLGIYKATDLLVKGLTYGYNITPSYTGTGSSTGSTNVLADNSFTISQGTLRVGRASSIAAGNITIGSDQTIGAFEFEAKGEPVIISAVTLTVTTSTTGTITCPNNTSFKSVKLVDENGSAVAGPTDRAAGAATVSFTDTFTVPTGIHNYKVVGTLDTSCGWTTNDTIYVGLNTPASGITAKGETTGLSITPSPASNITTVTQTVKTANLTVAKNSTPTNKSVITNSTGVLIGSWNFDATNSGEDVRITSLSIRASTTAKLNNLTLKDGSTALSPVNDAPSAASANATSTFALSSPIIITKGTSKNIDLYADIGSNAAAGEVDAWGITDSSSSVTAYGVTTGNAATVTVTASDGALITIAAAGTLTVNTDSSLLAPRLVVGGSTGVDLSEVRLKATNEPIDITKLTVRIADGGLSGTNAGSYTQVSKVYLKIDGQIVGDAAGYAVAAATKQINLERGVLTIPTDSVGKKLSILGDTVLIDTNEPGVENADIKAGLSGANGFTATGNGSNSSATITYTDSTGSAVILHKSYPSVTVQAVANSSILHRTNITAVGGKIGIYKLSYVLNTTSGVSVTNAYLALGSSCGSLNNGSVISATDTALDYLIDGYATTGLAFSNTAQSSKYYLDIAKDATCSIDLYATVGETTAVDKVTTSLLGDLASAQVDDLTGQPAAAYTVNNKGNFVWSDLEGSDVQSTNAAITNKQWYNGYLVTGLAATSTPIQVSF